MDIEIDGVPYDDWKYTTKEWWMRDPLDSLPMNGSARLKSGVKMQVDYLRETGNLITNIAGARSEDYCDCDLPIYKLGYAGRSGSRWL